MVSGTQLSMYVNQLGAKVPKIVYVTEEHISCTGENDDHPKVYYTLKSGEAERVSSC